MLCFPMMCPRNEHLTGLSFHVYLSRGLEGFLYVIEHLVFRFALDHQIFNISFYVLASLFGKRFVNQALISGTCVS
ncbi:hypothetical protein HanRHA438_Chr00c26g0853981 [Helianthus annuus]|nr:hypothetical protein HanRHA438_Chr00c26g0853981 [Helianthus annuus]